MKASNNKTAQLINRIPIIGVSIFALLYVYSATLYPGGSQANITTVGFDWINNYWCNLMAETSVNELPNPAQPFAITATVILCLSLMLFFIQFGQHHLKKDKWLLIFKVSAVLSMLFALFIFSPLHDLMTLLSSVFGIVIVIGVIRIVAIKMPTIYKTTGIFCIILLIINNYIYYTKDFLFALPLLQKLTFAFVLIWLVAINITLIKAKEETI